MTNSWPLPEPMRGCTRCSFIELHGTRGVHRTAMVGGCGSLPRGDGAPRAGRCRPHGVGGAGFGTGVHRPPRHGARGGNARRDPPGRVFGPGGGCDMRRRMRRSFCHRRGPRRGWRGRRGRGCESERDPLVARCSSPTPSSPPPRTVHLSRQYTTLAQRVCAALGNPAPAPSDPPPLRARAEEIDAGVARLAAVGIAAGTRPLVVAPGARYGPAKQYPPERFAAAVRHIHAREGEGPVIVVGATGDRDAGDAVRRSLPQCVDLVGHTELAELIGILAVARGRARERQRHDASGRGARRPGRRGLRFDQPSVDASDRIPSGDRPRTGVVFPLLCADLCAGFRLHAALVARACRRHVARPADDPGCRAGSGIVPECNRRAVTTRFPTPVQPRLLRLSMPAVAC